MEIQKEAKTATANKPLFLTPYLREGRIPEARALARVDLPGIEVESYSGLISLNQAFNSNTFFWLFPAKVMEIEFLKISSK
jgi:vitellogenic carboxypeptidase-like protein